LAEWKLFDGEPPVYTTPAWYLTRERAPHLEEPGQRERLIRTAEIVRSVCEAGRHESVVDLGCGDGGLLSLLQAQVVPPVDCWGYDLSPAAVSAARTVRKVRAWQLDIVTDELTWGQVAVATEVLEHLVDPHAYVRRIAGHCQAVVASSPAYETDRNHYEFHTWAWDTSGYRKLFEQAGFTVWHQEIVQSFQVVGAIR
jgi:2-polyprenyl-3-methyl-5-hydroxy-6-metoxy-1,4-benzoquinol methylase